MAKYHEACRFTDDGIFDKESAVYHLKAAADCGIIAANLSLAKIFVDMPHDILGDVTIDDCAGINFGEGESRVAIGLRYMERAARAGERSAMVYLARAYDTGKKMEF